jgi:hypothetical protein
MAQRITDLDELLGDPKKVRLNNVTYTLPPDIPTELFLHINRAAAEGNATDLDNVERLRDGLLELFRYGDPKMTELPPISLAQLFALIPRVYGADDEDDGDAAPPRARPTRGGASTRTRSRTKSR